MKNNQTNAFELLVQELTQCTDQERVNKVLEAILTEKEKYEITNRLQVFAKIKAGNTQRDISSSLRVGVATVSRGVKSYKDLSVGELIGTLLDNVETVDKQ